MAGLMYEGSELPESVKKAAQGALDYAKAIKGKLPLAVEGSGIPEGVRKAAQKALEEGYDISPKAAAEVAEKGAEKGLLGRALGALGGAAATGVQAALYSGDAGDPSDQLSPAQREAKNPGEQADATAYAQRVQQNAQAAAQTPPQGAGLLMAGQPQPEQPQAAPQQPQAPQQAPQGPDPRVVAAQRAETEQKRQTIERGALHQLQTNELSRTKAAEAVVQADFERRGVDATPKERQQMVAQEISSMRNMSNPEMAKYLSYAMLAVGIGASIADKSGQAFNNFATAGMNAYSAAQQRQLQQAQMEREYQLKVAEQNRKNRDTDSNVDYRKGTIGIKREGLDLDRDKFGYDQQFKNTRLGQYDRALGQGDVRNGIAAGGLGVQQAGLGLRQQALDLQRQRIAQQNAKDAAQIKKLEAIDVPDISQKDMTAGVEGYMKDAGYKVSPGAASTVSDQVIRWRKQYPNVPTRQLIEKAAEKVGVKYEQNTWTSDKAGLDFDEE